MKLLLAQGDVDPNKRYLGWTPFQCASKREHKEVVKLLLTRDDVTPDMPDAYPYFHSQPPHILEHWQPTMALEDYLLQHLLLETQNRRRLIQTHGE